MNDDLLFTHFPDWHEDAACRETAPDLFFPDSGLRPTEALNTCASCPVRVQCLTWALENDESEGIWGGLTSHERRNLKRRNRERPRDDRTCSKPDCDEPIEAHLSLHFLRCAQHRAKRKQKVGATTHIREWAAGQGYAVGNSGPLAADVLAAYEAAHMENAS